MVWSHPYNSFFFILLALGLAGSLALAFALATAPNARSKAIIVLRALAIGTLVLILLNPTHVQETRQKGPQPAAVFLLDLSRSMGLEAPRSRARAGLEFIEQALVRLPRERRPEIRRFGFGRDLAALADNDLAQSPMADETRLYRALEQLAGRFGDGLPFGVFVFSDGRSTDREPIEDTARAYRVLGLPVHVVPLGDERVSGDVAIADIDAPRDVPAGDSRAGARDGAQPRLCGKEGRANGAPDLRPARPAIATMPLTLADGEQTPELVIESDPAKGGSSAAVSSFPHEAVASNNSVAFQISPRKSKLRVIYMEGTGTAEYRFLQDALQEDPDIGVHVDARGRSVRCPAAAFAIGDAARGYPTTREELFGYDVVICSDIARTAFTDEQLAWTAELVAKRGAASR